MKKSEQEVHNNEILSAFIDAEQTDAETAQIVDALLNDPDYKKHYARMQLVNDSLQYQIHEKILRSHLQSQIATEIDDLPAHFVADAVSLELLDTRNVTRSGWFQQLWSNRMVSGISVAASVMFVTLLGLNLFDSDSKHGAQSGANELTVINQPFSLMTSTPSLITAPSELPASWVSSSGDLLNSENLKQQYQWIEADPALSNQVRQYVNQHEIYRTTYSLQPKIRTATYQLSE